MADTQKTATEEVVAGAPVKAVLVGRAMKSQTRLRVSKRAVVAVQGALTYLLREIVDGTKSAAEIDLKKKALPKHVQRAVSTDPELRALSAHWLLRNPAEVRKPGSEAQPSAVKAAGTRKRSVDVTSHQFRSSIKRIAREKDCALATAAMDTLATIAAEITADLTGRADEVAQKDSKKTIHAADVRGAVEGHLPGELKVHTVKAIETALAEAPQETS
ncbi:histone-like protein [Streptomyces sp. NPDC006691]|uniref:histone-like protein n=1 Tax=Streptomyces sp. NPDC006691 TaxID=3364757 RepID=UPI0036A63CED